MQLKSTLGRVSVDKGGLAPWVWRLRTTGGRVVLRARVDDTPPAVGGYSKRAFDIVAALGGLFVLAPVLLVCALLVKLQDGGSCFYGHARVGRGGKTFRCLKLRTMVTNGDEVLARHLQTNAAAAAEWAETRKLKDDPRVTRIGRFLRKTSLDELPQLINILRGEMSVVGPRPVVEAELARYGSRAKRYLAARPGLTGLWQISGRNDTTYSRRIAFDVAYVNSWSFANDIVIVTRTIPAVIRARGTY